MEKDDFKEGTMKYANKFPSYSSWTIKSHVDMSNRWGNSGNSGRLYLFGSQKSLQMVTTAMKLKDAYFLEGKLSPTQTAN